MRTLEEQIEVTAPVGTAWSQLHRVAEYPEFVGGVVHASARGRRHAELEVEFGGERHQVDAELTDHGRGRVMSWETVDGPPLRGTFALRLTDHGRGRVMSWETVDGPPLRGTFALRPLDAAHTQVQVRLEYDPEELKESLGGPRGFAQSRAVEEAVRTDLQLFKELCEE